MPNRKFPNLCPVRRGLSIVLRYLDLVGYDQPAVPLAVYRTTRNSHTPLDNVSSLYAAQLTDIIRSTAAAVLHLDPTKDKKELQRFTAHSLRVGACQILYANGFNSYEIQALLRWESLAFMTYLRDIAWVARKQTAAMSAIAEDDIHPFL